MDKRFKLKLTAVCLSGLFFLSFTTFSVKDTKASTNSMTTLAFVSAMDATGMVHGTVLTMWHIADMGTSAERGAPSQTDSAQISAFWYINNSIVWNWVAINTNLTGTMTPVPALNWTPSCPNPDDPGFTVQQYIPDPVFTQMNGSALVELVSWRLDFWTWIDFSNGGQDVDIVWVGSSVIEYNWTYNLEINNIYQIPTNTTYNTFNNMTYNNNATAPVAFDLSVWLKDNVNWLLPSILGAIGVPVGASVTKKVKKKRATSKSFFSKLSL